MRVLVQIVDSYLQFRSSWTRYLCSKRVSEIYPSSYLSIAIYVSMYRSIELFDLDQQQKTLSQENERGIRSDPTTRLASETHNPRVEMHINRMLG